MTDHEARLTRRKVLQLAAATAGVTTAAVATAVSARAHALESPPSPNPLDCSWKYDLRPGYYNGAHHSISVWKYDPALGRAVMVPGVVAADGLGLALQFQFHDDDVTASPRIKLHHGSCNHVRGGCQKMSAADMTYCLPYDLVEGVEIVDDPHGVLERG